MRVGKSVTITVRQSKRIKYILQIEMNFKRKYWKGFYDCSGSFHIEFEEISHGRHTAYLQ